MDKITLQGSERAALPAAHRMSGADPSEQIRVTILVRRHAREDFHNRVAALGSGKPSGGHLTRAQFAARYGASAADLAAVRAFADSHSLAVLEEHAARRSSARLSMCSYIACPTREALTAAGSAR